MSEIDTSAEAVEARAVHCAELWCDLRLLMGRASLEGHGVGQMLAVEMMAKIADVDDTLRALAAERDALVLAHSLGDTSDGRVAMRVPVGLVPAVHALVRGEAVAVPVEPTMDMLYAAAEKDNQAYCGGSQHGADDETIYAAMLAASPFAVKP